MLKLVNIAWEAAETIVGFLDHEFSSQVGGCLFLLETAWKSWVTFKNTLRRCLKSCGFLWSWKMFFLSPPKSSWKFIVFYEWFLILWPISWRFVQQNHIRSHDGFWSRPGIIELIGEACHIGDRAQIITSCPATQTTDIPDILLWQWGWWIKFHKAMHRSKVTAWTRPQILATI